jgi:hypothetical protein
MSLGQQLVSMIGNDRQFDMPDPALITKQVLGYKGAFDDNRRLSMQERQMMLQMEEQKRRQQLEELMMPLKMAEIEAETEYRRSQIESQKLAAQKVAEDLKYQPIVSDFIISVSNATLGDIDSIQVPSNLPPHLTQKLADMKISRKHGLLNEENQRQALRLSSQKAEAAIAAREYLSQNGVNDVDKLDDTSAIRYAQELEKEQRQRQMLMAQKKAETQLEHYNLEEDLRATNAQLKKYYQQRDAIQREMQEKNPNIGPAASSLFKDERINAINKNIMELEDRRIKQHSDLNKRKEILGYNRIDELTGQPIPTQNKAGADSQPSASPSVEVSQTVNQPLLDESLSDAQASNGPVIRGLSRPAGPKFIPEESPMATEISSDSLASKFQQARDLLERGKNNHAFLVGGKIAAASALAEAIRANTNPEQFRELQKMPAQDRIEAAKRFMKSVAPPLSMSKSLDEKMAESQIDVAQTIKNVTGLGGLGMAKGPASRPVSRWPFDENQIDWNEFNAIVSSIR